MARRLADVPTPRATTDEGHDLPIPREWISELPSREEAAKWWAEWENLPPIELGRPAAEILAEVRGEESYDS